MPDIVRSQRLIFRHDARARALSRILRRLREYRVDGKYFHEKLPLFPDVNNPSIKKINFIKRQEILYYRERLDDFRASSFFFFFFLFSFRFPRSSFRPSRELNSPPE